MRGWYLIGALTIAYDIIVINRDKVLKDVDKIMSKFYLPMS